MRRGLLIACALVLPALSNAPAAWAQELAPYDANADLHRRIEELERIVAQLPQPGRTIPVSEGQPSDPPSAATVQDLPSVYDGDAACCCDPYHVGQDFFNRDCRTSGLIGGAEVVFLKPFATNGDLPGSFPLVGESSDFGFEATPRFWLGYVRASGLGSQFRYWEFDHTVHGTLEVFDPDVLVDGRLKFRTYDWELLQQVNFRRWWLQMSGGIRYAEVNVNQRFTEPDSQVGDSSFVMNSGFDGVGLTTGLQATRDLTQSGNLQMTAGGRISLLFGSRKHNFDIEFADADLFDISLETKDDLLSVFELNVGPRYTRRLANGANAFIGGGFEAQQWLGAGTPFSSLLGTLLGNFGDVGFVGLGVNLGVTR